MRFFRDGILPSYRKKYPKDYVNLPTDVRYNYPEVKSLKWQEKGYTAKINGSGIYAKSSERNDVKIKDGTNINSIMQDMMSVILDKARL